MNLLLFYSNKSLINRIATKDITGIIVDWERKGKEERQIHYNTEINIHDKKTLVEARSIRNKHLICRVNGGPHLGLDEISTAISLGADEILIPMVTHPNEIIQALEFCVSKNIKVGILVETLGAVESIHDFAKLPLSRVFFGLNDYAIQSSNSNIFSPIIDDTIKYVADAVQDIPFGFGGLTHTDLGSPISCRLLLAEMIKHGCSFSFLRRSFYRDLKTISHHTIYESISQEVAQLNKRSPDEIKKDTEQLYTAVKSIKIAYENPQRFQ